MKNSLLPVFRAGVLGLLFCASAESVRAQYSLSILWNISTADNRPYVTTNATERGIAYNPANNHVYVVSRPAAQLPNQLRIAILDGETGAELGFLNVAGISGGTFALSTIAVAEDGAIYGANLVTSGSNYRIYRWADEAALPAAVFIGNPAGGATGRWGDTLDIRGGGTNTEILVGGVDVQPRVAILRPTNDTFTGFASSPITIAGIATNDIQKGVSFGAGNTFYAKRTGLATLRHIRYDLPTGVGTVLANLTINANVAGIAYDTNNSLIAGVQTGNTTAAGNHQLHVYDASVPGTLPSIGTLPFPTPAFSNVNVVSAVDLGNNRVYALDTHNGLVAARIIISQTPVPPAFAINPASQTVVQGGYTSFSAAATGSQPITYQWLHNGYPLPNETNTTLLLTNIVSAQAGEYRLMATNPAGSTNSSPATLTVTPAVLSTALTPLWKKSPGELPFLNGTDNNHRGMAYNPVSGHLLVVSRTGSNAVYIIDADTGDLLGALNLGSGIITGGTAPLNLISVTADGVIFAGNLTLNGTTDPFRLYQWYDESPNTTPALVWSGDPGAGAVHRWGDTLAARVNAGSHEVLLASRLGTIVSFILPDFVGSIPLVFDVPGASAGNFGLGLAWGAGDRFWGKSAGQTLQHVQLDFAANTAQIINTITDFSTMSAIGVEHTEGLLAGLSVETPDNLRLLALPAGSGAPSWLDTEFWPTDNPNSNGTGAVAFAPGHLFALDSNNGLVAYRVAPRLRYTLNNNVLTFEWSGPYTLQGRGDLVGGTWTNISATSGHQVTISSDPNARLFLRLRD